MTFTFIKHPFSYEDLHAKDEGYGRIYVTPNGEKYPSITTCLSILSSQWLEEWKNKVGEEEANKISKRASIRGTALHEAVESYLHGINPTFGYNIILENTFKKVASVLRKNVTEIYAVEKALYSKELEVAGRADIVANYAGLKSIIDLKTSSKSKLARDIASYYVQTAFYAIAYEEQTGVKIDQAVIILAADDNPEPIVYITNPHRWKGALVEIIKEYKVNLTNQMVK